MDELEFNLIDLDLDREKTELYLLDKDIFDFIDNAINEITTLIWKK